MLLLHAENRTAAESEHQNITTLSHTVRESFPQESLAR